MFENIIKINSAHQWTGSNEADALEFGKKIGEECHFVLEYGEPCATIAVFENPQWIIRPKEYFIRAMERGIMSGMIRHTRFFADEAEYKEMVRGLNEK